MKQGSLLKYLIKQKGYTVKEFSEMAGFDSYASMSRRFKLDELPEAEIRHYAKLLDVLPDELRGKPPEVQIKSASIVELIAYRERLIRKLLDVQTMIDNLSK